MLRSAAMLRRVGWNMIAATAFGCATHTLAPSAEAPARAVAGQETPLAPRLRWNVSASSVVCSRTGTELPIPDSFVKSVRHVGDDEISIVAQDPAARPPFGALLVRAGRDGDAMRDFLEDWAVLHGVLTGDAPPDATIRGDVRIDDNQVSIEYSVATSEQAPRYRLRYARFRRNGEACRIGTIERGSPQAGAVTSLLGRVRDAPGLNLEGEQGKPREDPSWAALRGVLTLGAHIALGR